jgi:3(or 17)beta-hydroxysteroid dehydrogenase
MRKHNSTVALVTGAASGIGRAIADRLALEGARVVITDIQCDAGAAAASEGGFIFYEHDVCQEAQWSRIIREVESRVGYLTILVNNAGILGPTDASNPETTRFDDWKRLFAVNVDSVFLGCRAAIPAMRRAGRGAIINVSSIAAMRATPNATAYGAGKAAVRQLTKSIAQHCAQERLNIRCNSVHPGVVRTPLWNAGALELAHQRGIAIEDFIAETEAAVPMGDFTRAEDVAAAVSFLASDDARHITGAKFVVDGGLVSCTSYRAGKENRAVRGDSSMPRYEMP